MTGNWRERAGTIFDCQKQPASGSRGVVVSNHPLASAAGAEMLAAGGNAIDAAIATLFTLTVVEPMMVGIIGGGMAHIRLSDGSHRVVDGQSTVPRSVRPDTYTSKPGSAAHVFDTVGDANLIGAKAVAVPGSLKAWCETLRNYGTMSLADVLQPAIKHALAVGGLVACAQVFHHLVGVQDVGTDLVAEADVRLLVFPRLFFGVAHLHFALVQLGLQHFHGGSTVLVLGAFVLAGNDDAGGNVRQAHGGIGLVDVLAARAAGTIGIHAQVFVFNLDVDVFINDGRHGDRAETGVPARV